MSQAQLIIDQLKEQKQIIMEYILSHYIRNCLKKMFKVCLNHQQ
jgi:hypothetical protein